MSQNDLRHEELRNSITDFRSRLNAAGVEIACAIAAGYVVGDIPAEQLSGITDLRARLHAAECELAVMEGRPEPSLPLCMIPLPVG